MESLFTFNDFKNLYRLAKIRNRSKEDYFQFQKYQGELLVRFLRKYKIIKPGDLILDLGCAFGGYSSALKNAGTQVIGLDFFPMENPDDVPMIKADANKVPIPNETFDLVICASLIEHVANPQALIMECLRVLKKNGILYLSFPPYYSPNGGHQFAPYHLLGQKFAIRIATRRGLFKNEPLSEERFLKNPDTFTEAFGKWGLYKMTLGKARDILSKLPVKVIKRATRYLPVDISGIPILNEFVTWHVQYLIKKL